MNVQQRNNVQVFGGGPATLVFAHGFGCDQNMWRLIEPAYRNRFRTVLFDLVGSGMSDLSAYERAKYDSLQGYADDVLDIDNVGHCPHLSAPRPSTDAMDAFLAKQGF